MKSTRIVSGALGTPGQYNSLRDDAAGSGSLLAHQQLGAFSLGTNPNDGQTLVFVVNGTSITLTGRTVSIANPGEFKIGLNIAATLATVMNLLANPWQTNGTQIALSLANQQLLAYVGASLSGTTITVFSLNNAANAQLTSFSGSTTFSSGSWAAQTMKLYVEGGTYYVGTTRVLFTGGSTPTFTAPASNPRIDIVTADSSGTLAVTQGTENASPTAPAYPANKAVICEVYNVVGETAIYDNANQQANQGYISNDVRQIVQPVYISATSQIASGLFVPDPGSEVTGDLLKWSGSAWVRLPAGASGLPLVSNGAGVAPTYQALPALNVLDDEQIAAGGSAFTTATFTAKTYLRVVIIIQNDGSSLGINMQFNGDTSAHYAWRQSQNGGADTTNTSQSMLNPTTPTNGGSTGTSLWVIEISNISATQKTVTGTVTTAASTVATAPGRCEFSGVWNSTAAQVTSITIGAGGTGTFTSGDRIIVYGN